jgi:glycosyltransferase involved in cell wall biosynthesis
MAAAICDLVRNPAESARMGIAARRRVETEFDMRACAAKYSQLYHELLGA